MRGHGQISALPLDLVTTSVRFDLDWREPHTVEYRHRPIRARFNSPLLNTGNLAVSGDSGCRRVAERVAKRLKPIGFVSSDDPEEISVAAELVERSGGTVRRQRSERLPKTIFLTLAIDGIVGELFDLEALADDYRRYLPDAPTGFHEAISAELERIRPLRFAEFEEFADVEIEWQLHVADGTVAVSCPRPETAVRCGLLLGYPAPTTAALLAQHHNLAGGCDQ